MRTILLAAAVALIAAPAAAETVNMQPGKWEGKVEVNMPGMPTGPGKPFTQCVTEEDLGDPADMLAQNDGCQVVQSDHSDDVFTYELDCGESVMTGRIAYHGDSYEGSGTMVMNAGGQRMEATMTMEGRRLGACD